MKTHRSVRLLRLAVLAVAACVVASAAEAAVLATAARENPLVSKYAAEVRDNGWVAFQGHVALEALLQDLTAMRVPALGISPADALVAKPSAGGARAADGKPAEGVVRLGQTHAGLRVEDAMVSVHHDAQRRVQLMHGKLVRGLPAESTPALGAEKALAIALAAVGATVYAWDRPEWEQQLQSDLADPGATYRPTAELLYARATVDADLAASSYRLAYRFEIKTLEPADLRVVMVDAQTGGVLRNASLLEHSTGTVFTIYNGARSFTTDYRGFPNFNFVLKDQTRGEKLHTLAYSGWPWELRGEIHDHDNTWYETAATAHWAVQRAWDYFRFRHGRNGMDNGGGKIRIEADNPGGSSFFTRSGGYDYIVVADFGLQGTVDIVAHEFTHGVDSHEGNLSDVGDADALDESFGDIFGVMAQQHALGVLNWTIGEEYSLIRSLSNPPVLFHPDTFGDFWWNLTDEPHSRAGVQNKWFFLLSQGGADWNGIGNFYNVQGIGPWNAASIAYRNLTTYIQANSTYADSRAGAVQSAVDLFGQCSPQETSTRDAWFAVGVGDPAPWCTGNIMPGYVSMCIETPYPVTFSLGTNPTTNNITWDVPWNFASTVSWDTHSVSLDYLLYPDYTYPGSYFVTATATDPNGQTTTRWAQLDLVQCYCDPNNPYQCVL